MEWRIYEGIDRKDLLNLLQEAAAAGREPAFILPLADAGGQWHHYTLITRPVRNPLEGILGTYPASEAPPEPDDTDLRGRVDELFKHPTSRTLARMAQGKGPVPPPDTARLRDEYTQGFAAANDSTGRTPKVTQAQVDAKARRPVPCRTTGFVGASDGLFQERPRSSRRREDEGW